MEVVRTLLAAQPDVNAKNDTGYTALMNASRVGHVEVVRALLAAQADVNAKDRKGLTALMLASKHPEVGQLLKNAGAKGVIRAAQ